MGSAARRSPPGPSSPSEFGGRIEGHTGEARLALKLNRAGRCLVRRSGPEGIDMRVGVTVHRRNEPDFRVHVVGKSRNPANEQHPNALRAHTRPGGD